MSSQLLGLRSPGPLNKYVLPKAGEDNYKSDKPFSFCIIFKSFNWLCNLLVCDIYGGSETPYL